MYRVLYTILIIFILTGLSAAEGSNTLDTHQNMQSGDWTHRRIEVPVLMYHYVGEIPEDADEFRVGLTVEESTFQDHMNFLKEAGYTTVHFSDLDRALQHGEALPEKPIILTFDDGHLDHYTNVFPALQAMGFQGTFFIITGRIDSRDPNYMSWDQVREMRAAGMQMEPHTKNHLDLRERGYDFLVYEILGSIESLQAHTEAEARVFSYPAGRYDEQTLDVLEDLPVQLAVTTQPGTQHTTSDRLEIKRIRVSGETTAVGLNYLLSYDWETE